METEEEFAARFNFRQWIEHLNRQYGDAVERMTRKAGCAPSFAQISITSLEEILRHLEKNSREL